MPTSVARLGREKRIETLAKNLFVIDGPDKAGKLRRAEQALLKANPQLATEAGFESGAAVIVPALRGLLKTDRVSVPTADLDGLLAEASARFHSCATVIGIGLTESAQRNKDSLARLEDREFVNTARTAVADSAKLIASAREHLEKEQESLDARGGALRDALTRALADVDRLSELARRAPNS